MTRWPQIATRLVVLGTLAGGVLACHGPGSPGELPSTTVLPTPELGAARSGAGIDPPTQGPPTDAGAPPVDSYAPPLPPLPDGSVPADSRLEPRHDDR